MHKKEVDKLLNKVQRDVEQLLLENRLEWLQRVCREAEKKYSFGSLGELVAFMFGHASDIQLKGGEVKSRTLRTRPTDKIKVEELPGPKEVTLRKKSSSQ